MTDLQAIKHLVILMMENRSFDHYLGALNFDDAYPGKAVVDGLERNRRMNRRLDGAIVNPYSLDGLPLRMQDPPHEWPQVESQVNGGQMDGFVTTHQAYWASKAGPLSPAEAARVMGYYTRETLPVSYYLADQFAVCDQWFSSFSGSTWPNRCYLHAGGCGKTFTTRWDSLFKQRPSPIWRRWAAEFPPFDWRFYTADFSNGWLWLSFMNNTVVPSGRLRCLDTFPTDCATSSLPQVTLVEPPYFWADDHPAHQPQRGQAIIRFVVDSVLHSPLWESTAIVITYDEHGGFFDHVAPPLTGDDPSTPRCQHFGPRVPTLVVSPYTPRGRVVNQMFDHTSIMASIAARWGLPLPAPPRSRASRAATIWKDCFNFSSLPRASGSINLPQVGKVGLPPLPPAGFDLKEPTELSNVLGELTLLGSPTQLQEGLACYLEVLSSVPGLWQDYEPP